MAEQQFCERKSARTCVCTEMCWYDRDPRPPSTPVAKAPFRIWQWRKANREVLRLRNALRSSVEIRTALHVRVGVAEGWLLADADTVREIQAVYPLYKGPRPEDRLDPSLSAPTAQSRSVARRVAIQEGHDA